MVYICEICNYTTLDSGNYSKHKRTVKHLRKVDDCKKNLRDISSFQPKNANELLRKLQSVTNTENSDSYQCIDGKYQCSKCGKIYSHLSSLSRHKLNNKCQGEVSELNNLKQEIIEFQKDQILNEIAKKKEEELRIRDDKIVELEKKIVMLETKLDCSIEQNKEKTSFIMSGKIGNNNNFYSARNYAQHFFPDAPCLAALPDYDESMEDYKMIMNEDYDLIDVILHYHEQGVLHKYLGDFIISHYKKEDPTTQSIWNSDSSRFTYVIKELIANDKSHWSCDKNGLKTIKCIINPMLDYLKKLLANYEENLKRKVKKINEDSDSDELININQYLKPLEGLKKYIDEKIADEIVRYIAPNFYMEPRYVNEKRLADKTSKSKQSADIKPIKKKLKKISPQKTSQKRNLLSKKRSTIETLKPRKTRRHVITEGSEEKHDIFLQKEEHRAYSSEEEIIIHKPRKIKRHVITEDDDELTNYFEDC